MLIQFFFSFPGPAPENDELPTLGNEDDGDDDDDDTVAGPKIMAHVDLAKTVCK